MWQRWRRKKTPSSSPLRTQQNYTTIKNTKKEPQQEGSEGGRQGNGDAHALKRQRTNRRMVTTAEVFLKQQVL